jgi:glutamate--cysteine ligase
VRYLDTQPGDEWIAPVAVLAALLGDDATTEAALELAGPTAGAWVPASRSGLADPGLRRTAAAVLDLACRRLEGTGLSPGVRRQVIDIVQRRLRDAEQAEE